MGIVECTLFASEIIGFTFDHFLSIINSDVDLRGLVPQLIEFLSLLRTLIDLVLIDFVQVVVRALELSSLKLDAFDLMLQGVQVTSLSGDINTSSDTFITGPLSVQGLIAKQLL